MDNKQLKEYIEKLEAENLLDNKRILDNIDERVGSISYNSMDVSEGTLFVCKGEAFKESYLQSALQKRAICYVYGEDFTPKEDYDCSWIKVNDIRKTLAVIANFFYDEPWRNIKTVGITGTKGKTTTAYLSRYIINGFLKDQGCDKEMGFLSSIETYDGKELLDANLTTPETFELYHAFKDMKESKLDCMLMEVSSQALKYHRTYGINYDIACFTNISHDHISDCEHHDFEDYFKSKLILMGQCKTAILNMDMPTEHFDRIVKSAGGAEKIVTYGLNPKADVTAINIVSTIKGLEFDLLVKGELSHVKMPMIGEFNVSNALAAAAITTILGIDDKYIVAGLAKAYVPGRMNLFYNKERDVSGIVDFAHNTISYEALFGTLKKLKPDARLTIIFGGSEGKGINRRKDCAVVANKYVNRVVLTEEDPGKEDVISICKEIQQYITNPEISVKIIVDRGEAIKYALDTAMSNEIVIVAGKGTDTTIKRFNGYEPTPTDVDFVKKYLL